MSELASPCPLDVFLESLSKSDRAALQPITEMLETRYAFPSRDEGGSGGQEVCFLSAREIVPARKHPGGRWDVRIVPLALVISVALREEPAGLEVHLELYESSPVVLRWADTTLATVVEEKAFQLLMSTCGFAGSVPERTSRAGFRGLS